MPKTNGAPQTEAEIIELTAGVHIDVSDARVTGFGIKGGKLTMTIVADLKNAFADLDGLRRASHADFRGTVAIDGRIEKAAIALPEDDVHKDQLPLLPDPE